MSYTENDILKELDEAITGDNIYNTFLDLEHPYFYTAGNQINLFVDETRWAIVFEKTGYDNRALSIVIELYYFGNCLSNLERCGSDKQYVSNMQFIELVPSEELEKIDFDFELVSPKVKNITVRETILEISHDTNAYEEKGIEIMSDDNPDNLIDFMALTRYLDETNPTIFRATDEELRTSIPFDLPKILVIKEFNIFSVYSGKKPSNYETFQLIANILVSKNISVWKPSLPPNNDWRNWPEAGAL